jgi:hypothetical protein
MQTLERMTKERQTLSEQGLVVSRSQIIINNCLWFVLSSFIAIAALEAVFFLGHLGEECFVQIEPLTGFGHIPAKLITWRAEGYSQSQFENNGVRKKIGSSVGAEFKNVVLLGDSVLEALQVPYEKSFAALLEKRLNASGTGQFNFLNYGTSAYGTLQEYLQYIHSARKLKPRQVILFYHQGDNNDNVLIEGVNNFLPRPYCKTDEQGKLVLDRQFYDSYMDGEKARSFHSYDFLRNNSRIFGTCAKIDLVLGANPTYQQMKAIFCKAEMRIRKWLAKRYLYPKGKANNADRLVGSSGAELLLDKTELQKIKHFVLSPAVEKAQTDIQQELKLNDERMVLTCGIIAALARECSNDNCRLLLVGLPAPEQNIAYTRELNAIARLRESKLAVFDFENLNCAFSKMPDGERKAAYFVYGDHLKAKGHEIVAEYLYRKIAE